MTAGLTYDINTPVLAKAEEIIIGRTKALTGKSTSGATVLVDPEIKLSVFYAHHMLNPQESYYQPRLRNVDYSCIR